MILLPGCLCCPPPPPERCWCPDLCSYVIELVEPSALAVKHSPYSCVSGYVSDEKAIDSLIADLLAFEVTGQASFPPGNNQSRSVAFHTGGAVGVSVSHAVRGFQGDIPEAGNRFEAEETASVYVYCSPDGNNDPKYYARLILSAAATFSAAGFTTGFWRREYYREFDLSSSCDSSPSRSCFPIDQETAHISTPLTITLSGDGTSSLGSLVMINDSGSPADFPYARDAVDDILGGIAHTFRITARENCEPLPDPCSVLIDGVRVAVSSFDPYEVITAEWRGLSAPGRDLVLADGVVVQDIESGSTDAITTITRCDDGQTTDIKAVYIATGGAGIVNQCITQESISKYQPLVCEVVNENTARLYGGIATVKVYTPCPIGGVPSGNDILEESQWSWECLLVDGVPGAVTVSPLVGARYFNRDPVVCQVTHAPPVVTLDFVP